MTIKVDFCNLYCSLYKLVCNMLPIVLAKTQWVVQTRFVYTGFPLTKHINMPWIWNKGNITMIKLYNVVIKFYTNAFSCIIVSTVFDFCGAVGFIDAAFTYLNWRKSCFVCACLHHQLYIFIIDLLITAIKFIILKFILKSTIIFFIWFLVWVITFICN